jgi:tRNA (guanine37-N1)-methyltransferase
MTVRVDILTLFPAMFPPVLQESILRIAQEKGLAEYYVHDLRGFGEGARRNIDDRPYGGGPGMVMICGPVFDAVEEIERQCGAPARRILTSPQGRLLDDALARELADEKRLLIICGHYEGYDERIAAGLGADEVSIGDYVLTGGELAAMVIVDALSRLIPGVLGDEESHRRDSFADGRLGYPQYTRPPEFRGMTVPEILLSGDHQRIAAWRAEQAKLRTAQRRPDLLVKRGRIGPLDDA